MTTLAVSELNTAWREFDTVETAREGLLDVLPALLGAYGPAAATLGADWYDDMRIAENVPGRFVATPSEVGDQAAESLARWGIGPLFQPEPDWQRAQAQVEGGLQMRIANTDRASVTDSVIADPQAEGWQRFGEGACAFCAMLISRGAVYSKATAAFGAHEGCGCVAAPAFGGRPVPVKPYTPTSRNITDADRARVRAWIRENT